MPRFMCLGGFRSCESLAGSILYEMWIPYATTVDVFGVGKVLSCSSWNDSLTHRAGIEATDQIHSLARRAGIEATDQIHSLARRAGIEAHSTERELLFLLEFTAVDFTGRYLLVEFGIAVAIGLRLVDLFQGFQKFGSHYFLFQLLSLVALDGIPLG